MDNSTAIQKLEQRYKKVSRSKVGIDELVQDSNTLSVEIDNEILSVQDNEFIKNKKERLNKLGKSKDEVSTILKKLKIDIKDLVRSRETKSFSFNKTYSAKEVLGKLDPELIEEIETESEESKDPEINKSKKQTASKKESNNKKLRDADKASEKSRVKIDVDASDPNYEPIKVSITEDKSSINKIAENNEKVYNALLSMGEVDMANHVHMMMERVKVGPKYKYVSEITNNTQELKSVNDTNSKIEKYLGEIRDSLRTKQDTNIDRPESVIGELREREALDEESNPVEEGKLPGFVETLLSMLFGKALMGIFKAGRGLLFIAKSILRPAIGWLLLKLSSGISALFNNLMSGPLALFNSLRDKVSNFISNTFEKFKGGVNAIKTRVSKLGVDMATKFNEAKNFAKTYVNGKIAKVTEQFSKFKAAIKNTLTKIPGVGKLLDWMKDDPKLSEAKQKPTKSKGLFSNAVDSVKKGASSAGKYVKGKVVAGGAAVYAAGKGAVDWSKGKLADVRKGISEVAAKVGAKFSGIPKKLTEHVNKTGGIPPKTGIMGKLNKFTKVLRPIPFLGQALMVGFAAKAAYDGWNEAGQLYGVPQDQVSAAGKTASAVGGLVKDLLWPLPISQETVASIALSLTGQSPVKGGKALKGDYDENAALGDIDQFQQPPNDDFQPGGFSDEELLTASFKNVSSMLPDSSMNQGADTRGDKPSISPGSRNTSRAPAGFGNFSADTHPVQIGEFKTEELGNLVGSVSAKYESGRQGVHTVSSGSGDPGGVSYGTYQLASKTGTMQSFLNSSDGKKYREMFSGTTPGSAAFNNIYAQIANKDPVGFNAAQHNFIKRTHYDPVASIASSMGVKVSDRAVQEALWSQSVQHGRKGNTKIIQGALDKADPNDVPAFLRALYNSRSNYISGLKIPSNIKSSINSRYSNELNDVLSISGSGGSDTIVDTLDTPIKAVPIDVPVTKTDDTGSPTVAKAPSVSAQSAQSAAKAPTASAPSATGVVTSTNMQTGEVTTRAMAKDEELEIYKNQVKRRYDTLNDAIKNNKSPVVISRMEGILRDSISSLKMYLRQNNIDHKTIPEAREYRRKNLEELSKFSATPTTPTPEKKVPEVPVTPEALETPETPETPENKVPEVDNQELQLYKNQVKRRYDTLNNTIKNNGSPLEVSRMEGLLRDSISSLKRYLRNNNIDPDSIPEAREYRRENLEELSKTPVTPEKKVTEVPAVPEYDNSDIPVVPEYLANPKPYSKPASLDLSASDLMKVESKTPVMMQGVEGARPAKIKKPEDNEEHDPQQDVEEDEAVQAEYDQPTKGNGTDLKALQAKYVSLYAPWNPDFDGLRTETKERFLGMAKEFYETTGNKIQVNSAFRSMKKQQELYDNRHNNSNPVAAPGGSIHNYGMALDIQSDHVKSLKSSGLLAKYGFGTPVASDPPHIEDITVDRAKIRQTPYNPENQPGVSSGPSFGDAYDGEASDYGNDATQSASDLLESLGIDTGNLLSSFQGAYTSATTAGGQAKSKAVSGKTGDLANNIDNPLNNKTKSQQEMESIILETQEIAAEENNSVYSYIDKVTSSLQQSINNNTVINNSTSEPTSEIFSINNTEYYPDQELRY